MGCERPGCVKGRKHAVWRRTIAISAAQAKRAAPEAHHRRAVERVVAHAEEQVAQERAVDAVIPRSGRGRQRRLPHVACDLQVLLVVEVEVREAVGRVGRGEVDRGVAGARRAAHPPNAPQKRAVEGGQEGGAVMRVGMGHKGSPARLAEHKAHDARNARGGRGHERTPALAGTAARKRAMDGRGTCRRLIRRVVRLDLGLIELEDGLA